MTHIVFQILHVCQSISISMTTEWDEADMIICPTVEVRKEAAEEWRQGHFVCLCVATGSRLRRSEVSQLEVDGLETALLS